MDQLLMPVTLIIKMTMKISITTGRKRYDAQHYALREMFCTQMSMIHPGRTICRGGLEIIGDITDNPHMKGGCRMSAGKGTCRFLQRGLEEAPYFDTYAKKMVEIRKSAVISIML